MNSPKIFIGIDTSNYKTSVAAVDEKGSILCNLQQYLEVKKGERGLRQSAAFFQHVNNLPGLLDGCFAALNGEKPVCIAVSSTPRPQEGSYMPVFNAGVSAAKILSAALHIPCYTFSHQEGHIEAVRFFSPLRDVDEMLSFHFSGGTTEALLVKNGRISIIGGSRDIAFGQVLDRVGVKLGMEFPCGEEMDKIASRLTGSEPFVSENILPPIKCNDGFINLSGIETCCQRAAEKTDSEELISMLFMRIGEAICAMTEQLSHKYGISRVLYAGGVSASRFIRRYIRSRLPQTEICFGEPALSTDNAVGTAILGGKKYGA